MASQPLRITFFTLLLSFCSFYPLSTAGKVFSSLNQVKSHYDFVIVGGVVVNADETAAAASNIAYISAIEQDGGAKLCVVSLRILDRPTTHMAINFEQPVAGGERQLPSFIPFLVRLLVFSALSHGRQGLGFKHVRE